MVPLLAPVAIEGFMWFCAIFAVSTGAAVLLAKSDLPAKMQQYIRDHLAEIDASLSRKEQREPTPYTNPELFSDKHYINGRPFCYKKKNSKEIWQADTLHADHFEVYSNQRNFDRGVRNRAVFVDGRLKSFF